MKKLFFILSSTLLLAACGGDDHCETGVSGCPGSYYSCPEAANCYPTSSGCASSGECDD